MTRFCVFSLYGPMASWGEIAVGEDRHSADHPTKSAIIGMVGASLGIRRDQEELHTRLAESMGMACLVLSPGNPIEDFHTIQTPPQAELKSGSYFKTRRDELSVGPSSLYTIISRRDYRCDTYVLVCLWMRKDGVPFSLEEIAQALNNPRFTLYLGRKSCPPGLPLNARIMEAPTIIEVFSMMQKNSPGIMDMSRFSPEAALYWDSDGNSGVAARHVTQRRDEVLSRQRWTFLNRFESYEIVKIDRPGG